MSIFGPPNIDRLLQKKNVEGLIKALNYKIYDSNLNTSHKSANVRIKAIVALYRIGDPRAVEPIINSINDVVDEVSETAMLVLGEFGDPRAIEPIIKQLENNNGERRTAASKALARIGTPAVKPLLKALNNAKNKIIASWDEITPYSTLLHIYSSVIGILGEIGDKRAVLPLIKILKKISDDYGEISEALGKIGDPRAVEPLIEVLFNDTIQGFGTQRAMDALIKIGTPKALDRVIDYCIDKHLPAVPHFELGMDFGLIDILGRIGTMRAVDLLIPYLAEGGAYHNAAASALMKIGGSYVIEALIKAQDNEETQVEATKVLERLGYTH